MIDLHSHILPGVDDGAPDLETSLEMARIAVADGVEAQACTPHILPGLYNNTGPRILSAVQELQRHLDDAGIPLRLVAGADVHLAPDIAEGLRSGRIPSLADSRYVLVEPPHHVAPVGLVEFFFGVLVAGYVPILTHPERLSWIESRYALIEQLFLGGVFMQITAGSLTGVFGPGPLYWAERMLDEGRVHILASDAHNVGRRRPNLGQGRDAAAKRVGEEEAHHLVVTRPRGILENESPFKLPPPAPRARSGREGRADHASSSGRDRLGDAGAWRRLLGRVRTIFR